MQISTLQKVSIGLVQMACVLKNKKVNLQKSISFLEQLEGKADIVCFPELFTTGYNLDLISGAFYDLAETIPGPTTELLGQSAIKYGVAILGNIVERDEVLEGVLYNTTFLLDAEGRLVGKYRKSHLFPTEHSYFRAGNRLPVFDLDGLTLGMATCFDHAFPQIFTILALQGAQVVFIPSVVPVGYEYLLNLRTRARAQDNQYFAVAINRVGHEGDVTYCGLSKVVNPRGEVLAEASNTGEELLMAELDLRQILKERKQEPVLRSQRPELYQPLANSSQ
jgi:predicted amidohydrolase